MTNRTSILFVIGSLNAGGAEKSLTSLLNTFPLTKYDVDLMLMRKEGLFLPLVPCGVNVVDAPLELQALVHSPADVAFYKHLPIRFWFLKVVRFLNARRKEGPMNLLQLLWLKWVKDIPEYPKRYDVAVSYMDGTTNYYVIDKINAGRKFLWVHSDYKTMTCDRDTDRRYFDKADAVITISPMCRDSLVREFPDLKSKFHSLENISNPLFINMLADKHLNSPAFNECAVPRIISVGRMTEEKGYLLSIEAARELVVQGVKFKWFIIGDGPQRPELEAKIKEYDLSEHIYLLGLQSNPYYFIKHSEVFVQASRYEGKSIAIDEAKILRKCIVVTDFATVYDAISDMENGIIVKQTPVSLAKGIKLCIDNQDLREKFYKALEREDVNNVAAIDDYLKVFGLK